MLISSQWCGFNISFRRTSLDSCKLFPCSGLESKHQVLHVPGFSVYVWDWVTDIDGEMHYTITKLKQLPKPLMHISSCVHKKSYIFPSFSLTWSETSFSRPQLCEQVTLYDLFTETYASFHFAQCTECFVSNEVYRFGPIFKGKSTLLFCFILWSLTSAW